MATRRHGPYDAAPPSFAEVQRSTSIWTPGDWDVREQVSTRTGRTVHLVGVEGKPILYALREEDANLAAAAPNLYRAIVSLLGLFESAGDSVNFVSMTGLRVHVPRHQRHYFNEAINSLAKARGRRRW